MKRTLLSLVMVFAFFAYARAQTTAFNFQGRLNDGAVPANGRYDVQFKLFDAVTGGAQIGATLDRPNLMLVNGVFSTPLDFGVTAFNGGDRFIEISLRATGSGNAFIVLGARQQVLSVPYNVRSLRATLADDATHAVNADNLGSIPPTGFIQNRTTPQTATINLDGSGTFQTGVIGKSSYGNGIYGESSDGNGVYGVSSTHYGVYGSSDSSYGVYGKSVTGYAGYFEGTTRTKILEISGGSDLAEKFEFSEIVEPGMVVAIDERNAGKLSRARGTYNRRVAGVVSGANNLAAGMILPDLKTESTNTQAVALSGRVWVYADATKNSIKSGDLLTTADEAGYAMKITDYKRAAGATIGKAMTELKTGRGLVLVLVSLQ